MTIIKTYILLMGLGILMTVVCFFALTSFAGALEIWERSQRKKTAAKQRTYLQTRHWRYDLPGRQRIALRRIKRKSVTSPTQTKIA